VWADALISCEFCYDCESKVYDVYRNRILCKFCSDFFRKEDVRRRHRLRVLIGNINSIRFCLTEIAVCRTNKKQMIYLSSFEQALKKAMAKPNKNVLVYPPNKVIDRLVPCR
jgi:hypothetical protein